MSIYIRYFKQTIRFILFIGLSCISINTAIAGNNICSDNRFDEDVPSGLVLRIINEGTSVFLDKETSTPQSKLHFGKSLSATEVSGNRFYVKDTNSDTAIGWVDRENLLCTKRSMIADNGLEGRVFIKTEERVRTGDDIERYQSLEVSQSSATMKCANECRKLSRFSGFFIYATQAAKDCKTTPTNMPCVKYLIADKPILDLDDILVGWVSSDDVFLWNNAYGLRLSESFIGEGKEYKYICGYRTLEEAKQANKKECAIQLTGGWVWYETSTRMLLQDSFNEDEGKFYKVISPMAGERVDLSKSTSIGIGNLKHMDIVFLVDGTKSMLPAMSSVRQVMRDITDKLPKGIQYRFAFQVYRDSYAKDNEFGDGYPFSSSCNANEQTLEKNKKEFISNLDVALDATKNDSAAGDRDHQENIFGGIKRASKALRLNCPEHMKLLFIIGDTGYSPANQRNYYHRTPIAIEYILKLLDGENNSSQKNQDIDDESGKIDKQILAFFLQTENKKPVEDTDYQQAYTDFTKQAEWLVNGLSNRAKERLKTVGIESKLETSDYLYSLNEDNLPERIATTIKQYAKPVAITEFDSRVAAGEAPADVIKSMMGDPRFGNIPGRLVEQIIASKCSNNTESCKAGKIDKIVEFYIKDTPDIVEDIWMRKKDYKILLEDIRKLAKDVSGAKDIEIRRVKLASTLIKGIEKRLGSGMPLNAVEKGKTVAEIYRDKLKLAVPIDSPLFNIPLNKFETLPICVIERLSEWIVDYAEIMGLIQTADDRLPLCGTQGVDKAEEAVRYMPPRCGRTDEQLLLAKEKILQGCSVGKEYLRNLVNLELPIETEFKFPSSSMRISHPFGNYNDDSSSKKPADIMWVPKNLLP